MRFFESEIIIIFAEKIVITKSYSGCCNECMFFKSPYCYIRLKKMSFADCTDQNYLFFRKITT